MKKFLYKACDSKYGWACISIADIYLQAKDYDNAEIYADKACGLQVDEYSYDRGCALLNDIKRKKYPNTNDCCCGIKIIDTKEKKDSEK